MGPLYLQISLSIGSQINIDPLEATLPLEDIRILGTLNVASPALIIPSKMVQEAWEDHFWIFRKPELTDSKVSPKTLEDIQRAKEVLCPQNILQK